MTSQFHKMMAAGLTTPFILMNRNTVFEKILMNNQSIKNECAGEEKPKSAAQEDADNLDKIF